jgi:hypothetical protein
VLPVVGAVFLLRALHVSADSLAALIATRLGWGTNPAVNHELIREVAVEAWNNRVGLGFLLLGATLQLVNQAWPMRYDDFEFSWAGALLALLIALALALGARAFARRRVESVVEAALKIISKGLTEWQRNHED